MNVSEFLDRKGYVQVPNPKYNPKAKKNKQPKYIQQLDLSGREDNIFSTPLAETVDERYSVPSEVVDKYAEYGVTYNRVSKNLDAELANAQSVWEKGFNMVAQTVVSELIGGTLESTADLGGALVTAGSMLMDKLIGAWYDRDEDDDYGNPVSDKIAELREKFNNEVVPIHADPNLTIQNGGLGSFGWWAKGIPQIASSLTLLLPTRLATVGVAKAVGAVAKANRLRKVEKAIEKAAKAKNVNAVRNATEEVAKIPKLNAIEKKLYNPMTRDFLKHAGQIGSEALIMRTLENYQEGKQTYQDLYKQSLDKFASMDDATFEQWKKDNNDTFEEDIAGYDKDQVSKLIARKAADRTFAIDYANIGFDVIQLGAIHSMAGLPRQIKSIRAQRAHRESIETVGKAGAEAVKKSTSKKAREMAADALKGGGKWFFSESSEGVEEAINYIAQQEGITYGKALLNGETESTTNGFLNSRLLGYLSDSELQESAFWGWLGGLTFGGAMETYNKHKIQKQRKAQIEAINKLKGEGEKKGKHTTIEAAEDWLRLAEAPEVYAATESIRRRNARLNQLSSDLKLINDGKNPFSKDEQTNTYNDIEGDLEIQKNVLRNQVIKDYRAKVAMDAINSGTYDMLTDYLSSKGVRKAFVDLGIADEANVDSFINETLQDLHDTKEMYNTELANVNYQITALNKASRLDEQIPAEYVRQIAKFNADRRLDIKKIDKQIADLEAKRAEIENNGTNLTEEEKQIAIHALKIQQLQFAYGKLEAKKQEIKQDENLSDWRKAESIDDINRQQEGLLNYMKNDLATSSNLTAQAGALGDMLYVLRGSKAFRPYGQFDFEGEYQKTDEELIKEFEQWFDNKEVELPSIQQQYEKVTKDIATIERQGGLRDKNAQAYDLYNSIADLEVSRAMTSSMIAMSQTQIRNAVDVLHNQKNAVRQEALASAEKKIREIYLKHIDEPDVIRNIIIDSFFNDKVNADARAREQLTDTLDDGTTEGEALISAINILNFSQGANRSAFRYILDVLDMADQKHRNQGESPTGNQNPSQSPQGAPPNNPSSGTQQGQGAAASGQNGGQIKPKKYAHIQFDNDGNITAINVKQSANPGDEAVTMIPRTNDDNYDLDISQMPQTAIPLGKLHASTLFNYNGDILNDTVEVEKMPILDENGNVVEKGVLRKVDNPPANPSTGGQGGVQPATQPPGTQAPAPQEPAPDDDPEQIESDKENLVTETLNQVVNWDDLANTDWNELKTVIINTLSSNNQGITYAPGELESIVNAKVDELESMAGFMGSGTMNGSTNGMVMASKVASRNIGTYGRLFYTSVDDMLNNYIALHKPPTTEVAGPNNTRVRKVIISGRDILAIIDSVCNSADKQIAINAFNMLIYHVTSKEGREKYILADEADCLNGVVVAELGKDPDYLFDQKLAQEGEIVASNQKLNIQDALSKMNNPNDVLHAATLNLFNSLKPGDELDVIRDKDGKLVFHKDGVAIGEIPLPYTDGAGGYFYYNEGWRSDVRPDGNGGVQSDLKDIISHIFTSNDPAVIPIQQLLADMIADAVSKKYSGPNVKLDWKGYGQRLAQIPYIRNLVAQSVAAFKAAPGSNLIYVDYQTFTPDYHNLIKHLFKLYHYTVVSTAATNITAKNRAINRSLDKWFNNLYRTYDTISSIEEDNIKGEIEYINEGKVYTISKQAETDYNNLPTFKVGVADKANARIGFTVPSGNGVIATTADAAAVGGVAKQQAMQNLGTYVVLHDRNRNPSFVKALGYRFDRNNIPPIYKDIAAKFREDLVDCFRVMWDKPGSTDAVLAREQALKRINEFAYMYYGTNYQGPKNTDRITLLRGGDNQHFILNSLRDNISGDVYGFEIAINIHGVWHNIKVQDKVLFNGVSRNQMALSVDGVRTYQQKTMKNGFNPSAIAEAITKFLVIHSEVNFDRGGIEGDNTNEVVKEGYIQRIEQPDGTFKIVVKGKNGDKVFNTYNDFILENDLIKVNTKILPNGTNYEDTNFNMRGNKRITVNIKTTAGTQSQPPVGNISRKYEVTRTDTDTNLKASLKQNLIDLTRKVKSNTATEAEKTTAFAAMMQTAGVGELYEDLVRDFDDEGFENPFLLDLIYDPEYNSYNEAEGENQTAYQSVASVNSKSNGEVGYHYWSPRKNRDSTKRLKPGRVVVGDVWLNMLSSRSAAQRGAALKHLLHEKLHILLENKSKRPWDQFEKKDVLEAVKVIYDAFVQQYPNLQNVNKYDKEYVDAWLARYNNKNVVTDFKLEEFLVEAMTSQEFFNVLNAMSQTDGFNGTNTNRSFFDKILDIIRRIFGWQKVADDKLYNEMLVRLRNITNPMPTTNEDNEQAPNEEPSIEPSAEPTTNQEPANTPSEPPVEPEGDTNDEDEDDDDYDGPLGGAFTEAPFSAIATPLRIPEKNQTSCTAALVNTAPAELRKNLENIINKGWINLVCK